MLAASCCRRLRRQLHCGCKFNYSSANNLRILQRQKKKNEKTRKEKSKKKKQNESKSKGKKGSNNQSQLVAFVFVYSLHALTESLAESLGSG